MATISRSIGPLGVDVSATDDAVLARLDDLLSSFPPRPADAAIDLDIEIVGAGTEHLDLRVNAHPRLSDVTLWEIEDRLLSNFNGWLLARQPDRIHVHGALVSKSGVGALLVGASGSGKSTFTAHLVRQGWTYHTDETAASVPGTLSWGSYPRPITLKRGSWAAFADLPSIAQAASDTARAADRERAHVALRELGGNASIDAVPVGVVAFVDHRRADGPTEVSPLDAVTRLVAETLDLERAAIAGFNDLVRLARHAHNVALPTAELAAAAEMLERELAAASAATLALHERGVPADAGLLATASSSDPPAEPGAVEPPSVLLRRADVHGWAFPDGGVLHDFRSGATIRVDAAGIAAWTRLDGRASLREIAAASGASADAGAVRDLVAFARHLADLGVVVVQR